tara:strand:- start:358 stop:723 length:366 start_codon:yes stop_codon:yes gene_type:complete
MSIKQNKFHTHIFESELGLDKCEQAIKRLIFNKFYVPTSTLVFDNWANYLQSSSRILYSQIDNHFADNPERIDELLNFILMYIVENNEMYVSNNSASIKFVETQELFFQINKKIRKYLESE